MASEAPPSESTEPKRGDARDLVGLGRAGGGGLDRVADLEALLARRAGVEHDLVVAVRPLALLELQRGELAAGVVDADAQRLALRGR